MTKKAKKEIKTKEMAKMTKILLSLWMMKMKRGKMTWRQMTWVLLLMTSMTLRNKTCRLMSKIRLREMPAKLLTKLSMTLSKMSLKTSLQWVKMMMKNQTKRCKLIIFHMHM